MSEKSTLEDVRIISLEGQVALQKIELEKLSSNLEEHRWDAAAIHDSLCDQPFIIDFVQPV